jgi:hypothetical protein
LSSFIENLNFLDRYSKNTQISNLIKIIPVGAELFHADRRADMTKLMLTFRNFANALIKRFHGFAKALNETQHQTDPWHSMHEDEAHFVTASRQENF